MLDPELSAIQQCREALEGASAAFAKAREGPVDPPAIDALDFLLETLAKDLRDLMRVLQGPR
jgi:hypothetical protein